MLVTSNFAGNEISPSNIYIGYVIVVSINWIMNVIYFIPYNFKRQHRTLTIHEQMHLANNWATRAKPQFHRGVFRWQLRSIW